MKNRQNRMILLRTVLCLAAVPVMQLPAYSAQPGKERNASAPCLPQNVPEQQTEDVLPVPEAGPDRTGRMLQVTPELLAQIDGIIDDTVAEALAAQRRAYELQAAAERRKTAASRQGLERSRNFWRNTAVTACTALAAGICTGIVLYRRNQ